MRSINLHKSDMANDTETKLELPFYAHRGKPYGAPMEFQLGKKSIAVRQGATRGDIPYSNIARIRLLYRPKNTTNEGYETKIELIKGRSISLGNLSWKSMMDMTRQDGEYRRFVEALVAKTREHNPALQLVAGMPAWLHKLSVLAGAAAVLTMVGLAFQSLLTGSWQLGVLAATFSAYFIWWTWRFMRRNRPQMFEPGAIPSDVMPPVAL
jgi:hypothetical protein